MATALQKHCKGCNRIENTHHLLYCGYCLSTAYCSDLCASNDWAQNHQFECLQMRVPTAEELEQWAEENPSGWTKWTVPRRWPEDWIWDPNYYDYDDVWGPPEVEQHPNTLSEAEEDKEEIDPDWTTVPPTVILFDPKQKRRRTGGEKSRKKLFSSIGEQKTLIDQTSDVAVYRLTLAPGELLKPETHPDTTQTFQVLQGRGIATVGGKSFPLNPGALFMVPRGVRHAIQAGKRSGMLLLTTYSPAEHHTIESELMDFET